MPSIPGVLCVDRYASVIPYHFFRAFSNGTKSPPFASTTVPNDTSFANIIKADFLVFDQQRGLKLLGPNPSYQYIFKVSNAVHEAPRICFFSEQDLSFPLKPGFLSQLIVNLNHDPSSLSEFISDSSIYAFNGGTFHKELIY